MSPFKNPPSSNREKSTTISGATSNLVNAVIGTGIVGMPYTIKETGLVAGVDAGKISLFGTFSQSSNASSGNPPSPPLGCKSPQLKSPPPAAGHKVDDDDDDDEDDDDHKEFPDEDDDEDDNEEDGRGGGYGSDGGGKGKRRY